MSNPFDVGNIVKAKYDPAEELLARAKPDNMEIVGTLNDRVTVAGAVDNNVEVAGAVSDKNEDEVDKVEGAEPPVVTYAKDDVLPILDQILNNGYAIDTFKLRNIDIAIRTRFTWEEKAIYKHLEDLDIKTVLHYQREFAFITMAASLVKFGNTVFKPINDGTKEELEASIAERYKFVISLNSILTDIIQAKLAKFDDKQRYIIKNFDELLKDF